MLFLDLTVLRGLFKILVSFEIRECQGYVDHVGVRLCKLNNPSCLLRWSPGASQKLFEAGCLVTTLLKSLNVKDLF